MIAVTDDTFEAETANGVSIVKFGAEWCGPCKMVQASLTDIKADYPDYKFLSVDVDEAMITVSEFGIRGIPTLIMFKDGVAIAKRTGATSTSQLRNWVQTSH